MCVSFYTKHSTLYAVLHLDDPFIFNRERTASFFLTAVKYSVVEPETRTSLLGSLPLCNHLGCAFLKAAGVDIIEGLHLNLALQLLTCR